MANEAVIVELMGQPKGVPVRFDVQDAQAIEKGTLLEIFGDRSVSGAIVTNNNAFAGIAAEEKVANDGSTTIGVWTKGIFDLTVTASPDVLFTPIPKGSLVSLSGANMIRRVQATDLSGGRIIGKALETGSASEVMQVAVGIY